MGGNPRGKELKEEEEKDKDGGKEEERQ